MNSTTSGYGGRLIELSERECWELLATRSVGRVAFDDGAGPTVLPVNHTVAHGTVRFRTSAHGILAARLDGRRVAFEADDVDEFNQAAWSVLVRGRARLLPPDLRPDGDDPGPWPAGQHPVHVVIDALSVTGRRLLGT